MKLLEGKTAVITGAARGIGKAIAQKFAESGANTAITDLEYNENMKATVEQLHRTGATCKGYASDASEFQKTSETVGQILKDFERIDILVNNAGITMDTLLMRMTEQQWDAVIDVNLKSVFNFTHAVLNSMLRQKSGSIINISSVVGVSGNAGQSNYAASKAGIIGFTKSIARELGSRNIRCNALAPGFILTEMTEKLSDEVKKEWTESIPLKRGGTPEDVANVALFLASELSGYITGQVIHVCGGMKT